MLEAIRERRSVAIAYAEPDTGQKTRRTIEPSGLVCRGDAWWLVAWCRLRKAARAFRVDAIGAWKPGAIFSPRAGSSFNEILARDRHLGPQIFGYGRLRTAADIGLSSPAASFSA